MPVWLRRSLIALAVLLGLAVAAAAYLVASFDPNRYKGLLIDWMREHKARTLAIDGAIGLSVFPRIEVTLRDVKLSEHHRPEEFAALQEATLAVQVMPLLRQQLAVDRVSARGVRVRYTRDAEGRRNIDDLLGPTAPEASVGAPADAPSKALKFDVSAIEFKDLQATVKDLPSGLDGRLVVEEFSTGRLADGAESPIQFSGRAMLAQPKLDAGVELAGRIELALPAGAPASVALRDMTLALRGEGFQVKQLDARLAGALAYDGPSGALQADKLRLTVSGERLGLALKDSTLTLDALRFDPPKRTLRLDALDVKLAGRSGENAVAAQLAWPKLAVAGDTLEGSALKGNASLKGGAAVGTVQIDFESQAPSGNFERIRVPGLRLAVKGSGAGRTVNGEVRSDLTLAPQPLAAALDALTLKLAFTDPALPPVNLALQGQAQAGAKEASWRFDGTINEQKFNAGGRADLARPVPYIDAQARFAALDLTRFVAPPSGQTKPAGEKPAADTPVDLSALKAVDGRFSLRAGTLVYPPYRIGEAALDATLAGGVLRVSDLSGRAWGGRFAAQASAQAGADRAAQRVGLKLDATDVDIAALLTDVAQFKKLEGKGRVTADVTTQGASVQRLKQALDGKAAFELRDGAVRGINLAKTLRQWRSAVTLNKDAVQASSAEEKTDFSEISASFAIADGVARSKDLSAKSPFLRVGGDGLVDIGRGRVDYLAKATVTGTAEGQGGADLALLKGVTVPVQLVGPFEAVDYKVQWSAVSAAVLGGAARGALGERAKGVLGGLLGGSEAPAAAASGASAPSAKEQVKEKAKDKARDELKKLFGR
ncbi:AsmA family protein [Methylibium sp.]|uniref:AsmA family protein n=1 Tax=Methylibium sp. TaxID=2067992 RepID=UPI003D0D42C9